MGRVGGEHLPCQWRRAVQFTTAECQRLPTRTVHFISALYIQQRQVENTPDVECGPGVGSELVSHSSSVLNGDPP